MRGLRARVQSSIASMRGLIASLRRLIATVQCLCARMQGRIVPVLRLRVSVETDKKGVAGATPQVLRRIDLLRGGRGRGHFDRGLLHSLRALHLPDTERLQAERVTPLARAAGR